MSVVELIEVELPDDNNNNTGGLDTVDGVEFILISIFVVYTYIIGNMSLYFSNNYSNKTCFHVNCT